MNYLGKYLKKRLKELKMSEREISSRCGISHSYLNQLIKGVNPSTNKKISPTLSTFEKLSKGFEVSIEDLQKIARGCTEKKSSGVENIGYSPEIIKKIKDFQEFMTELGIDKRQKTEEEWTFIISRIKELMKTNVIEEEIEKKVL